MTKAGAEQGEEGRTAYRFRHRRPLWVSPRLRRGPSARAPLRGPGMTGGGCHARPEKEKARRGRESMAPGLPVDPHRSLQTTARDDKTPAADHSTNHG
ncbi:hypothetical protein J4G37_09600 [Microvirga sp. 3-52]|nr:hypothetical protein [Microvirga sp. 3-52]